MYNGKIAFDSVHSIQLYLGQTGVTRTVTLTDPADSTKKITVNVGDSPRSLQRPAPATTKRTADFNAVNKKPL